MKWYFLTFLKEPNIPGWFTIAEMNLLYKSVQYINAVNCIELGTYMGRSAFAICRALKKLGGKRRLLCIDTFASPVSKEYYEREFMITMMNKYPSVREEYTNWIKYPTTLDCFKLTMSRYPFMKEIVEIMVADTKKIELINEVIDFALIDGDHTYEGVKNDFLLLKPLIRSGGIICFHDNSQHFPEVKRFINEIKNRTDCILLDEANSAISFQVL